MAVSPEALLDAAEALGNGDREVDWRNATSRGYYAAYHASVPVAFDAGLRVGDTGSVHAALVGVLTEPLRPSRLKSFGYMLEQCRKRRTQADYRIQEQFERQIADTAISDCRRILAHAKAIVG